MKKNPAQDALKSQSVNVMAPEVKRSKPRPRPVKPKSKAHSSTPEQQNISPVNNLPSLHLRSPHSRFGFVPPGDTADEDNNVEDQDDLEAGHAHDEGLGAHSLSADNNDSPDNSHAKKWRHARHISPPVDQDNVYTPPPISNNPQAKTKFKKNARPITPSADVDSTQRCRPVSPSTSTESDIPSPPRRVPKPVHSSTSSDAVHNVLQEHHAKKRCPRTPDLRTLQKLHQQTVKEPSDGEEDEEPQAVQPRKRSRPAANKVYQTIGFYPHSWKDVLEAAKKKSRLGLVMSGASSSRETFINKTAIEYLMETLEDFATDDIGVEAGIWDEHKHDMAIILWDDCATMQSEMKKAARPIAATKYGILPTDIHDDNEYADYACGQVEDLLDSGNFLHDGIDKQGRTNNLANNTLGEFCNEFAEAIPEGAVALAATTLAAAIDEYKTGFYKPTKFVSELYQPIYDIVMELYNAIKLDPYHSKKCRAVRKKWVHAAGALTHNPSNRRHNWGLKLKLD
ncbi:hypothetical protein EV702DRAFT_1191640 [Suillus placidus]|uniref:DUF6532 domain-containing protein n=1 Tax=Suillus placidus TaxID=48579 RepID=A0A9P7A6W6_9AGAM|nr:hypothetical protein EV702DRAFT_1191640 [Suillus placidus]